MSEAADALPWIRFSQFVLMFCGAAYVLIGLIFGPLMVVVMWADPELDNALGLAIGTGTGLLVLVLCVGVGVFNLVTAWGLAKRRKWAWISAIILGAMYAPSICLPFGVILLYGMLNPETRSAFID